MDGCVRTQTGKGMRDLMESAAENARYMNDGLSADEMLEIVMKWILSANDRWLRRHKPRSARKLVWWTDELERLKRKVRKCRRAYQRVRKCDDRDRINARADVYKRARNEEYKECIWRSKEANWKQFVSAKGNQDPWGEVYRVCMGKYMRDLLSSMKVGDRMTSTWRESVDVLFDRFFPAARTRVERRIEARMEERVRMGRSD